MYFVPHFGHAKVYETSIWTPCFQISAKTMNHNTIYSYTESGSDRAETQVEHDSMDYTIVNGYDEPGSYVRQIKYIARRENFDELVRRAHSCRQEIEYRCRMSRLLAKPPGVYLTLKLCCCWLIWPIQNDAKTLKND